MSDSSVRRGEQVMDWRGRWRTVWVMRGYWRGRMGRMKAERRGDWVETTRGRRAWSTKSSGTNPSSSKSLSPRLCSRSAARTRPPVRPSSPLPPRPGRLVISLVRGVVRSLWWCWRRARGVCKPTNLLLPLLDGHSLSQTNHTIPHTQ